MARIFDIKLAKKAFVVVFVTALCGFRVFAKGGFDDDIDRSDPKFVTASLLLSSPGNELFSCAGHAFIRMECPTFKLDTCYSYESEAPSSRLLTFFAGRLMMGMFAVPTEEFLEEYRRDGRGVRQYVLNLPPEVKQRLWKVLDERVAQGANLPYDYIKRGCAWSVMQCFFDAAGRETLKEGPWPEKYKGHQREIIAAAIEDSPWAAFFIHAIVGSDVDHDISNIRKVVIPADFLEYLKAATIDGRPVVEGDGSELLPVRQTFPRPSVTPFGVAWLLVFAAVVNLFLKRKVLDMFFLSVQALSGLFFVYLVGLSSLPATTWNWLLVPFNPLPLVFWRWRRHWAPGFILTLAVWEAFMLFSPHALTDAAYCVLGLAYIVFYAKFVGINGHDLADK